MKKIAMVFACFALVSMTMKAQVAKIALQHNGNVTLYDADQMPDVMNACVDGDTVYVNEGKFTNSFTISKKISIIGSGQNSVLMGNVTVNIPGTPTLTAHLLDALNCHASIIFSAPTKGAKIRKCLFRGLYFNATTEDATIDRCYSCGGSSDPFKLSTYMKNVNIINSKILNLYGDAASAADVNFINCNISSIYNYSSTYGQGKAIYINCIIGYWYSTSSNLPTACSFINCLCGNSTFTYGSYQNCWNYNNTSLIGSYVECILSSDQLQSSGYLGTDGTVVGIYGGTNPFTLDPMVPKVTESSVKLDNDTKKLNVNLKVSAN